MTSSQIKTINDHTLRNNELSYLCEQFIVCLDTELIKVSILQDESVARVNHFIASIINTTKLHTLLTKQRMAELQASVFEFSDISEFVLCLTDQFVFFLESEDFEKRHLAYNIAKQIHHNHDQDNNYMPQRITQAFATTHTYEDVVSILLQNKWLITVVMLYMFGQKSILAKK